jgi:hypothetical protein
VDEEFGDVISEYSLEQAIEDGVLVEWSKGDWQLLSGGKPIVVTTHLFDYASINDLDDLWNKFIDWKGKIKETLPEEDQMFVTEIEGKNVWVIEDQQAITMMYPEDY